MLKLSRISRSIIVIVYCICIAMLTYMAITCKANISTTSVIAYVISLVFSVCFYQVFKRKIYDKIGDKRIIRLYKYIYLAVIVVVTRIVMIYVTRGEYSYQYLSEGLSSKVVSNLVSLTGEAKYSPVIFNTILVYINAIVIKRIMKGIVKNDAIATCSSVVYILSPLSLKLCLEFNSQIFNTTFVVFGMYFLYKIYDQITKYGLKTKKYLFYTIGLLLSSILDLAFGGHVIFWWVLVIGLCVVCDYVDKQELVIYEKKYRIKKSILVLALVVIVTGIFSLIFKNEVNLQFDLKNMCNLILNAKCYYAITGTLILVFEIISVLLKRKCDSKVAIMFIATSIVVMLLPYVTNCIYGMVTYDAMLSMSLILSLGNIYYSRDEKIKLLNEKN